MRNKLVIKVLHGVVQGLLFILTVVVLAKAPLVKVDPAQIVATWLLIAVVIRIAFRYIVKMNPNP